MRSMRDTHKFHDDSAPWTSSELLRPSGDLILTSGSGPSTSEPFLLKMRNVLLTDITSSLFTRLQRDENGRFQDGDLAKILLDATEAPAGAYKARGTPEVLRVIELLSIEQGRSWGTCSVSYRAPLKLKKY